MSTFLVIAAGLTLGACGISASSGPSPIAKTAVPFHLLRPASPTTTTTPPSAFSVPVTVYFIAPSRQVLIASARSVAPPGTLSAVLGVLLAGPTTLESERQVSTGLPSGVKLLTAAVSGTTAIVNFNATFGQISGTTQVLAVAQIVYTIAAQLGTGVGVQFEIAGKPTPVPVSSGADTTGPVHLDQYTSLTPAPATTVTTTT